MALRTITERDFAQIVSPSDRGLTPEGRATFRDLSGASARRRLADGVCDGTFLDAGTKAKWGTCKWAKRRASRATSAQSKSGLLGNRVRTRSIAARFSGYRRHTSTIRRQVSRSR